MKNAVGIAAVSAANFLPDVEILKFMAIDFNIARARNKRDVVEGKATPMINLQT